MTTQEQTTNAAFHAKLLHTLVEYDRKQMGKPGYNVYALSLYCEALQSAQSHIDKGADVRQVLVGHFNGRLLSRLLKAADVSPMTKDDAIGSPVRRERY